MSIALRLRHTELDHKGNQWGDVLSQFMQQNRLDEDKEKNVTVMKDRKMWKSKLKVQSSCVIKVITPVSMTLEGH